MTAEPLEAMGQALTPKRAISYIRVSTRGQAQRGGAAEGFSIPAQREANKKKAASLGALIVKEFVDRGESARSANRPELQKMLAYIQEAGDIDYCIVHKLDRLARNRADDVDINRALDQAGVRLISTTENIDQTPGGVLLHGIMSSIAEFYSRNLANEVVKGMSQKARSGGTICRAPLGYLNKQGRDPQGREARWVELDPERAPLMRLAFTEYATGEWTLSTLTNHLTARGLTTLPTPTRPSHPLDHNKLLDLLRNPYYQGIVTYQGVQYPGKHEALVDEATWQRVQAVLSQHRNGERQRLHNHHLKTTIRCGQCGGRLIVHMAKSRSGQVYPYFVCSHRQRYRDQCQFKAVLIDEVEARVTDIYRRITITPEERRTIEEHLHYELDRLHTAAHQHTKDLTRQQGTLKAQQIKLLQAHYAGAIPLDLLKAEQTRITRELAAITEELHSLTSSHHAVKHHLTQALDLLQDCHRLYTRAPAPLKKLLNTIFFDHITVNPQDDDTPQPHRTAIPHPAPPFNHLTNPALIHATTTTVPASTHAKTPPANAEGAQNHIHFDPVSCKTLVVELGGFEPPTSSMPWKRATNCAIAPCSVRRPSATRQP